MLQLSEYAADAVQLRTVGLDQFAAMAVTASKHIKQAQPYEDFIMRLISDEALDLIAGGTLGTSIPSVTITGHVSQSGLPEASIPSVTIPGHVSRGDPGAPGNISTPAPGSGGGAAALPDCTKIHTSPAPAQVPAGPSLDQVRNSALGLAEQILTTMSPSLEHGVMIISDAAGFTRIGEWAHGTSNTLDAVASLLPGEKIVAWIHSHPSVNGVDERYPSSPLSNPNDGDQVDTLQWARLMSNPLVDPGAQMYVLDNKTRKLYEYPGVGPSERSLGNNVSDDHPTDC